MKKGATKNCELSTSSSSILCGKGVYKTAAEAEAAKIERDNARNGNKSVRAGMDSKCRAEKYRVVAQTAEEKVHKFRIALITSWVMIGLYFVVLS